MYEANREAVVCVCRKVFQKKTGLSGVPKANGTRAPVEECNLLADVPTGELMAELERRGWIRSNANGT